MLRAPNGHQGHFIGDSNTARINWKRLLIYDWFCRLSVYFSPSLCVCLSVYFFLSLCLSLTPSVSVCLTFSVSITLSSSVSVCLSRCLSSRFSLSPCLSVSLLFLWLSVSLSVAVPLSVCQSGQVVLQLHSCRVRVCSQVSVCGVHVGFFCVLRFPSIVQTHVSIWVG